MNCELFSVRDQAADGYVEPFAAPTIEFAIRSFSDSVQKEGHAFARYPQDFALFHVGTFDMALGVMDGFPARKIADASQFAHGSLLDLLQDEEQA